MKNSIKFLLLFIGLNCSTVFSQSTPDPGLPGPFSVTKDYYNFGDLAYKPAGFPDSVEVIGSVHYPTGLTGGPYPVLVFMHGRHSTCYETADPNNSTSDWPCATGFQSIVSFEGYDYLAQQMASHGYIVISVSANAINATDNGTPDNGMQGRAELIQHHLDRWNIFNTTGAAPFGTTFVGKLDMTNIGTMGHSRGGEGVVKHALYNASLGSPYGIKAVLPLAPVNFERNILNEIPLMNVAPYCDGDVSDLQGVHYYDDVRFNDTTDVAPKYSVLMMGANHNFFNTVWTPGLYPAGTADDWDDIYGASADFCGSTSGSSKRFSPSEQQAALISYASAFFRTHIGGETVFLPLLEVNDIIPPTSSLADSNDIFVSFQPPLNKRVDINRTSVETNEIINTMNDTVSVNSLTVFDICADDAGEADCGLSLFPSKEPHAGSSSELGIGQMHLGWDAAADYLLNKIPLTYQNVSAYTHLQFRTAVDFGSASSGSDADFTVELTDQAGFSAGVNVNNFTNALFTPPGNQFLQLPKLMYNTVRIPLNQFTGVDLTQVKQVKFQFNQAAAGEIYITDLGFGGSADLTAINSNNNDIQWNVFPNPFTNELTVQVQDENLEEFKLTLIGMDGKIWLSEKHKGKKTIQVSTQNLANGIYVLKITTGEKNKTLKLVKQ